MRVSEDHDYLVQSNSANGLATTTAKCTRCKIERGRASLETPTAADSAFCFLLGFAAVIACKQTNKP